MKVLLVTGGAGFIGSNFISFILKNYPDFIVINYDNLTYAGNLENLHDVALYPRYIFVKGDICDNDKVNEVFSNYTPDFIVNFAAESHVDRSIESPLVFGQTNLIGTLNLLSCAHKLWGKAGYEGHRFLQVSTDEVYGSLENLEDFFTEQTQLQPNSPYSATKAGADLLARAFFKTYGFPVIVTRCCNNYGPYQYKEKFIPTCISKALSGQPIPIYGEGNNIREWIHVLDHNAAIVKALLYGEIGEVYNIGSGAETTNIEMAGIILNILGKPHDAIVKVNDRPGHDTRYALDSSKSRKHLKWECTYNLKEGIENTVKWYIDNRSWWDK